MMALRNIRMSLAILPLVAAAAALQPANAEPARAPMECSPAPLLQEGKTQLLQRVLTRPGERIATSAGGTPDKPVPGFSVLYVYDRSPDGAMLQVGGRSDCKPEGWMRAEATVPWKHTMVAVFSPRTGRERALFFHEEQALRDLVSAQDAGNRAADLRKSAEGGNSGPVSSIEPDKAVDIREKFYLLPVLEAGSARFASQKKVKVLKVAAVTEAAGAAAPAPTRPEFKAAVVFVIDASASMQPYIDRAREAVDRVFGRIEKAGLQDRVRFGMIGYRDDPKHTPGIEYLTKVFVDPNKVATRADFNKAAADLKASTVSTRAFSEDGYAGIDAALRGIKWDDFSTRFVVLVTDASSRDPASGLGTTGLDAAALNGIVRERNTALFILHLETPSGAQDHAKAKKQYEELAQAPGCGSLYYPVKTGDVAAFGAVVDSLASQLTGYMERAASPTASASADAGAPAPVCGSTRAAEGAGAASAIASDVDAIAHAMRLAYLGRVEGTRVPPMFEAWTVDRDLANQAVATYDVRVLLTKTQLADLEQTVRVVSEAYRNSKIEPNALFTQLRSAAATLARDPSRLGTGDHQELSRAILGEYLDGLPYNSRIMTMDLDAWKGMSPGDQQAFIDRLDVLSEQYRRFHDDRDLWVKLATGTADSDAVYPISINALP